MRAVLAEGASMINDIEALTAPGALDAVADTDCAGLRDAQAGRPCDHAECAELWDVALEVRDYLSARISACQIAGIEKDRITIDPGFGFGKTVEHNFRLLKRCPSWLRWGFPWSRAGRANRRSARSPGGR